MSWDTNISEDFAASIFRKQGSPKCEYPFATLHLDFILYRHENLNSRMD